MPPHLHPRSRMTSSLFATTVAASFLVVGLPHLLPCPAPRVAYADAGAVGPDGNRKRVRRRSPQETTQVKDGIAQFEEGSQDHGRKGKEPLTGATTSTAPRGKRECPVPKPGGVIGELMGFKKEGQDQEADNGNRKGTINDTR